jgi:MFS family permease
MQSKDELVRTIPAFKEGIPTSVRFCVLFLFVLVFQFSGGMYMASIHEMVGAKALMHEDIMLAIEASFVGMSMIFPILFRLKFRFTSRTVFPFVACGLIACNLICMHTENVPMLVITCFIAGVIRMWGTFECFTSIQLRITPTRNYAVFFPFIFSVIFGCIQLSGLTTVYLSYFFEWQSMHYFIIGLLLLVIALSRLLLRPFLLDKPLPLQGIDWLGATLWSVFLLLVVFICEYGEHYDWLYSSYIRLALVAAGLFAVISIYRMRHIKNAYLELQAFRHPHVFTMLFLFMALCLLGATSSVLENTYTAGILHYDALNAVSLNWVRFVGVIVGGLLTWQASVRFKISYKRIVFFGFALLSIYQLIFYFLISPDTNIELFYFPLLLKSIGTVMLNIILTLYIAQIVPFQHRFQVLCIMGFIREGIGSPIATAYVGRLLKVCHQANYLSLSSELDAPNPIVNRLPFDALYGELQRQSLLVSIKEIFGYAVLFGIVLLIAAMCTKYPKIHKYIRMPVFSLPRRLAELKLFHRPIYTVKELIND